MWPLPATMSTNYQSVVTMYWTQTVVVQQNVTTSCHNVNKLSISCHCVMASDWSSTIRMWPLPATIPTNYQSVVTSYWRQTEAVQQNATTSCHNVHKLSIRCHCVLASNCSKFWCESIWNGQKMYCVMNFLCFLGRRFFQVGNHIKRTMCTLNIWDEFHTELPCLTHEKFFSGVILSGFHYRTCLGNMNQQVKSW